MKEIVKPLLTSLYILSQNFCKRPHQCKKGVTTLIVSRFLRGLKAVGFSWLVWCWSGSIDLFQCISSRELLELLLGLLALLCVTVGRPLVALEISHNIESVLLVNPSTKTIRVSLWVWHTFSHKGRFHTSPALLFQLRFSLVQFFGLPLSSDRPFMVCV